MTTLDDFVDLEQEQREVLYFSNWYTKWRHACEVAGLDPDEFEKKANKMVEKIKKKRRMKRR